MRRSVSVRARRPDMRLTVVGCGDAFGSGGRYNTCFRLEAAGKTFLIDCGASTHVALNAHGIDPNTIDAIILSHLHGDHFGGIPFLLLQGQFLLPRDRPLLIAGPPGSTERIDALVEACFPRATKNKWRFPWSVTEIPVGVPTDALGLNVVSAEVVHFSGAPSTALRISDGARMFAYSGDTQWTEALLPIANGADLFVVECYDYERDLTGHMNWATIKQRLKDFKAKRVMLTHMNPTMLAKLDEAKAAGVLVAGGGFFLNLKKKAPKETAGGATPPPEGGGGPPCGGGGGGAGPPGLCSLNLYINTDIEQADE